MTKPANSVSDAEPAQSTVARNATQTASLRLDRSALLGVFGRPDNRGALIRLPAGEVLKVAPGAQTEIGEILAIGDHSVTLSRNGRTSRLSMPR